MKKKVIALLLAAAMAMSLTACGDTSKTESTAEETAKQEETTKESENTEKPKNQRWYMDPVITQESIRRWMNTVRLICCYLAV